MSRSFGFSRPRRKWTFVAVTVGLAFSWVVGSAYVWSGPARFERRFPGFVEQNRALLDYWKAKPKRFQNADAMATIRENLRWAEDYRRLGYDPDVAMSLRTDESTSP